MTGEHAPRALSWMFGAVLMCGAAAQRTWIVDQNNGPGTSFTTLGAAFHAARPHDAVLVRPGVYVAAHTDKGLRVVGEAGATLDVSQGQMVVEDLPFGQTFVLDGFETTGPAGRMPVSAGQLPMGIRLSDNRGAVHLQGITVSASAPRDGFDAGIGIEILDCGFVTLHACSTIGFPAVRVRRSRVVMTECRFEGLSVWAGVFSGAALDVADSEVRIAQPCMFGATDLHGVGATAAIECWDSRVVVTGDRPAILQGGAWSTFRVRAAIDQNGGEVLVDPHLPLNPLLSSGPPITGTGPFRYRDTSFATGTGAAPGGTVTVRLHAPPHALAAQLVSVPHRPWSTPSGEAWLDPNDFFFLWFGFVPAEGVRSFSFVVPPSAPLGASAIVQGIHDTGNGPQLSLPVVVSIGG